MATRQSEKQQNLIYGRNPVLEWLDAGLRIKTIFLSKEAGHKPVRQIVATAEKRNIPVKRIYAVKLEQLAGTPKHQNIVAEVELPEPLDFDGLLADVRQKSTAPLLAMLDGVQDPHNLGAILRTADAAGIDGIIVPKDKAVGITPAVVKTSAGAAAHVPVAVVTNLARSMDALKDAGFWITGTDEDGDKLYTAGDFAGPTVIVLGSEGKGMKRLVRERCDFLVRIPMRGKVSSLNVSVAAGLLFYEARRQRDRADQTSSRSR